MEHELHEHDVIVIGAGGAGLRAAIEASAQGVSVGLICKSLLGKAHTAPMDRAVGPDGNLYINDNQFELGNTNYESRLLRVVMKDGKPVRTFHGDLEDAALWARALSEGEIAILARRGTLE